MSVEKIAHGDMKIKIYYEESIWKQISETSQKLHWLDSIKREQNNNFP